MRGANARSGQLRESQIRRMSALCRQAGGINLAQGFPDFESPVEIREAACAAIAADVSQYAVTEGSQHLREAITRHYRARDPRWSIDPDTDVCVTCGGTEALFATMAAVLDPGDEVVILEPFYESYGAVAAMCGAVPRYVPLRDDWTLDLRALTAACGKRTAMIVLNFPHNPSGSLLRPEDAAAVGRLAEEYDAIVLSDEMYDHLVLDGTMTHPALESGTSQRVVTVSGISKTYSLTGWRVGWTIGPRSLITPIKRLHDVVTCGAAAPLQQAAAMALSLGTEYERQLQTEFAVRRTLLCDGLRAAGFTFVTPRGGYFVLADYSALSTLDDEAFTLRLLKETGVAAVPGSYFFAGERGRRLVRFAFCKTTETLQEAVRRLQQLPLRDGIGDQKGQ
jgi:aspartate/methionine/tyrosine aminotransferase